ncbi:hypothetical protein F4859DRAFT_494266 [Xylaria cf. heliscus]|nr:hypothetical protein F4859DRAFT_494266 [Xylaria cf. heliscus]
MCGCQRITYLCLCNHKERLVERCLIYQLHNEASCWACFFPKCRTRIQRIPVQRVCRDCADYFRRKYGEHQYKKFIDYFLEYKERNGWGKTAIDPRTVPRDALLQRQSAPARISGAGTKGQGSQTAARKQPFQVHQPMSPVNHQVNRPPTPFVTNEDDRRYYAAPTAQVNDQDMLASPRAIGNSRARLADRELAQRQVARQQALNEQPARGDLRTIRNIQSTPADQQPAPVNRESTPFPHNRTSSPGSIRDKISAALTLPPGESIFSEVSNSSKRLAPSYIPSQDRPLPTDPSFFVVGDDDDDDDDDDDQSYEYSNSDDEEEVGGVRVFTPSPPPRYNSNNPPDIVPELAHLAQGRPPKVIHPNNPPELQQPTPRTLKNKKPVVRNADSVSDTSLVKKLTKVAKDMHIPNIEYIDTEDGMWVPRLMTPPKGKRKSRTPTPSPPPTPGPSGHNANPVHSYNDSATIDIAIEANTVSKSLVRGRGMAEETNKHGSGKRPSTYFIKTHPNVSSPTGSSVTVPPPKRVDGILIPLSSRTQGGKSTGERTAGDGFFKERGLPSQTYIQECRSASFERPTPVLVHAPRRRYSAAVQSCFCDDKMKMSKNSEDKCLSCRERDSIAREMNMRWI